jgi:hypothetical protein
MAFSSGALDLATVCDAYGVGRNMASLDGQSYYDSAGTQHIINCRTNKPFSLGTLQQAYYKRTTLTGSNSASGRAHGSHCTGTIHFTVTLLLGATGIKILSITETHNNTSGPEDGATTSYTEGDNSRVEYTNGNNTFNVVVDVVARGKFGAINSSDTSHASQRWLYRVESNGTLTNIY